MLPYWWITNKEWKRSQRTNWTDLNSSSRTPVQFTCCGRTFSRVWINLVATARPFLDIHSNSILCCRQSRTKPRPGLVRPENVIQFGHVIFEIRDRTVIAILRDFSSKTAMQWYTAGSATSIHCTRDSSSSLGTRRRLYRTTNTTQQRRYPARNDAMTSLAAAVSTCLHVTLACKYDAIHKTGNA